MKYQFGRHEERASKAACTHCSQYRVIDLIGIRASVPTVANKLFRMPVSAQQVGGY